MNFNFFTEEFVGALLYRTATPEEIPTFVKILDLQTTKIDYTDPDIIGKSNMLLYLLSDMLDNIPCSVDMYPMIWMHYEMLTYVLDNPPPKNKRFNNKNKRKMFRQLLENTDTLPEEYDGDLVEVLKNLV